MPIMPPRLCSHPGCSSVAVKGKTRCQEHLKRTDTGRPSVRERGYTARWDKVRDAYIAVHRLCERCEAKGFFVPAVLVHHKDRTPENMGFDNLEALCRPCHDQEHRGERFGNGDRGTDHLGAR